MINKIDVYKQLKLILVEMILVIDNLNVENFDYDSKFQNLLIVKKINFNYGVIKLIYFLVDMTCDSINHSYKKANENYTYNEVKNDIIYIISAIDNNDIEKGLETNIFFLEKLNNKLNFNQN